jgi:hypothetical protein
MKNIMYETHDFHNNSAHSWLYMYVMFGILLDCWNHWHDRNISLGGNDLAHKTTLTRHFLLKCLQQARKMSCHVC